MLSSAESPAVGQRPAARKRYARIPEVLPVPEPDRAPAGVVPLVHRQGPAGAVRRDQPDQGLHRQGHGAPVPGLRVRGPEVLRGGVPDQGPDLQPAALRQRGAADQGDRRDPAPARLHGRLPVDDGPRHVRGQRRRARRRVASSSARPASTTASSRIPASGRMLFSAKVIPNRGAWLEFETNNKDQLWVKVDRKRKIAATTLLRAVGYETNDEIAALFAPGRRRPRAPVHREHPRQGRHPDARRGADRGLQEAPPGRPADG